MTYFGNNQNHFSTTTTTTTTSSGSSTSSSTGARARYIEGNVLHGFYIDVCQYYAENFRRAPATVVRRDIAMSIKGGMTGECLRAIIDETMTAPRPSWAYCKAILKRCEGAGIKTLEDWNTDQQRRANSKNPALNYDQREYTEDEFGPDFFIDLDKWCREQDLKENKV